MSAVLTLAVVLAVQPLGRPAPEAHASAGSQTGSSAAPVAGASGASRLAREADDARRANRPDEAIALYRKALAARPAWAEGWWHLGMLLYERDRLAEAADAFERSTSLAPRVGNAWVMRGLCEFALGQADAALEHIRRGRRLGTSADPQFRQVMLYHEGLLLAGKAEFEQAQETLDRLAADGVESEDLQWALGLSVLRVRPTDVGERDGEQRRLALQAGRAQMLAARKQFDEAERAYQELVAGAPQARHVHYALGRYYVATGQPEKALTAFRQEIERSPDHVPARLAIAGIKAETDPTGALPYAEQAVALNPRIPLGHYLLGSLLLHTPDTTRAIAELERAREAVPDHPGVHYALGRAYARAGRTADARRARETFKRLDEQQQRAARRDAAAEAAPETAAPKP